MGGHVGPGWKQSRSRRRHRSRRLLITALTMVITAAVAVVITWAVLTRLNVASGPAASVHISCKDRNTDAAVIQQAIDSSPVGAAIEFQGGTCRLNRGLVLLSHRTYTGESTTGTVLLQDAPASYVLASESYVDNSAGTGDPLAIQDLTVACDGSGTTNGIILLNWQVSVQSVNVSDCGGSGIVDTNTSQNGNAIDNTSVNSRFDNNFITGSRQYGFEVIDSDNSVTDGFLQNNQIASSGLDAVHVANAAGWNISGNHLYSVGQNAIYALRLYATTISNNYIEDFGGGQQSGSWYGITGTAQNGPGSTILGNKILNDKGETSGARYIYIGITSVHSGTGYLAVTGNVIMGDRPSDVGMSFSGGTAQLVVSASGNEITGVGTARIAGPNASVTAGS